MVQKWALWNGTGTISDTECGSQVISFTHEHDLLTCNCLLTSEGNTRPGQSHSRMVRVRKMV